MGGCGRAQCSIQPAHARSRRGTTARPTSHLLQTLVLCEASAQSLRLKFHVRLLKGQMKAGVRKRGLLGRLWARTASICADLTMKASRLGFFRRRGRVQISLCSFSSLADMGKIQGRGAKIRNTGRAALRKDSTRNAPSKRAHKANPVPQDAIAAQ